MTRTRICETGNSSPISLSCHHHRNKHWDSYDLQTAPSTQCATSWPASKLPQNLPLRQTLRSASTSSTDQTRPQSDNYSFLLTLHCRLDPVLSTTCLPNLPCYLYLFATLGSKGSEFDSIIMLMYFISGPYIRGPYYQTAVTVSCDGSVMLPLVVIIPLIYFLYRSDTLFSYRSCTKTFT